MCQFSSVFGTSLLKNSLMLLDHRVSGICLLVAANLCIFSSHLEMLNDSSALQSKSYHYLYATLVSNEALRCDCIDMVSMLTGRFQDSSSSPEMFNLETQDPSATRPAYMYGVAPNPTGDMILSCVRPCSYVWCNHETPCVPQC
jgi:hypothetical protein